MKKRKFLLATLFACAILSSCTSLRSRKYEAYGTYLTATQVEAFCKAYSKKNPDAYYIQSYLGLFREKTHVLLVRFHEDGIGFAQVVTNFYVADIYVCDGWDGSYSLAVWVEGEGAYGIQEAYENGKISEEEIRSAANKAEKLGLRRYGRLAVPLEKFTFSLTWGTGFDSSYDSDSGTLVKTNKVIERSPEEYVTTFEYPSLESLYEKAKSLPLYSYPSDYNAYEGVSISTNPTTNYRLTIDDKTIDAKNCPIIEGYPEGLSWSAKEFLEIVFEIRDTILNSEEWKALPDYEVLYR
ncbi:MAG: hypothetical protein J5627_04660 [Bacilli bacterium]|nr:hypothetical protein [Bacilli bacterium]